MALTACSFCGEETPAAGPLFENEESTAAICARCVAMFAQTVDLAAELGEEE